MKPKRIRKPKAEPTPFQFKIEKGIPIPEPLRSGQEQYPFRRLKIGDSFIVPLESRTRRQVSVLTMATAKAMKKQGLPHTFTVRFFPLVKGTRVWRTA